MASFTTSRSITSATGSSQLIASAHNARKELFLYNTAATAWYICLSGGTASNGGVDCVTLAPGAAISITTKSAVTGIGTSSSALTAVES